MRVGIIGGLAAAASVLCGAVPAAPPSAQVASEWTFVSSPDFFNFDVPEPWPAWDEAVNWYLGRLVAERPEFVLVAGDLVDGRWWNGPKCVEHMAAVYFEAWKRRMRQHGLRYYVAVGDHELGDDPWPKEKLALVPDAERAFARHLEMPKNGPPTKQGLAYFVRHRNVLVVTLETFERVGDELKVTVEGEQLAWLEQVLQSQRDAEFVVVQGHAPVLGPAKARSSSGLYVEGGRESALWQTLRAHGVDLYLCGEFHDVTVIEDGGVVQIVHGSSWGRQEVATQDYLVAQVGAGELRLAMKSFRMDARGEPMWNLNKERGPLETVEIPAEVRQRGPETIGTLTIRKSGGARSLVDRSGCFVRGSR